jgi:hypothetical protein
MACLTALQAAASPAHWLRHQPLARIALGSQGGSTWLGLSVISLLE